jgi:hypothetical protein
MLMVRFGNCLYRFYQILFGSHYGYFYGKVTFVAVLLVIFFIFRQKNNYVKH